MTRRPRVRSIRRRVTRFLAGLLLLVVFYYGAHVLLRTSALTPTQVIAHRGGADLAPENTIAAFRNAIALGVDTLEFDVQMTRDGELVVIHDETIDRTTGGTGAVRDMSMAQIQALDAGSGEPPPTLQEVIDLAKSAGVGIFPETKAAHLYPGIEEKLLAAITDADYLEHTVVQSFEADSLDRLRQLNSDVQLCALYGLWQFDVSQPAGGANSICAMGEMVLLYPAIIRQAHQAGRPVFVWFGLLENRYALRVLRFFGADGFMVDNPSLLLSLVRDAQPQP